MFGANHIYECFPLRASGYRRTPLRDREIAAFRHICNWRGTDHGAQLVVARPAPLARESQTDRAPVSNGRWIGLWSAEYLVLRMGPANYSGRRSTDCCNATTSQCTTQLLLD
eukprot:jgi/Ulvmu1/12735/UM095_0040.1